MNHLPSSILSLHEIDQSMLAQAGGKGANLGELSKIEGIRVPEGFCISTAIFKQLIGESIWINNLLDQLSLLRIEDNQLISTLSNDIRHAIEAIPIPDNIQQAIMEYINTIGTDKAYAVRSSATAEDLPNASFAGQQDTYLNVIGTTAILQRISQCWASLFTERAITYRIQNGFDHRYVHLSVIVQQMVFPQVAGILFTADPISSNRKIVSIDAGFGLGEALVSGKVNADTYKVRDGKLIDKKIATKQLAIYASKEGGTIEQPIAPDQQQQPTLTDNQVLQLEQIGRKIEAHFGQPQDIEWCLADGTFYIVQSRPITTLFPIPKVNDPANHVYVSVGHQQMMTDAMKPLGISVWQLTAPRPMPQAGGRIFVDITGGLTTTAGRQNLLEVLGQSDPLIKDALETIIERGDFIPTSPDGEPQPTGIKSNKGMTAADILTSIDNDPAIATNLIRQSEEAIANLERNIQTQSGAAVFDYIKEDMKQRQQLNADPHNLGAIMAAINASAWLNENLYEWLGEKNVADTLILSAPNNITSEMGLELLNVADTIRPYPAIIAYLQQTKDGHFLEQLKQYAGGEQVRTAIDAFLNKYGMRCAGEIDITQPRWSEQPAALLPILLSNIRNNEPGAASRQYEQGLQKATQKEQEVLERLALLPDGEQKVNNTRALIRIVRHFMGYREYPKYAIIRRYFIYKKAILKSIAPLVQTGIIHEQEDSFYLTFDELQEAVRTHIVDYTLINQRKGEFRVYEKLMPPRVITSEGEIIAGRYKRGELPAGAIAGLPVSSGLVEGRARVVLNIADANLEAGDILVTTFTDPSWTPLFVSIKGLVTEVGGLMTHGAVIAREYGLPAVVGVENATKLIRDGQRIRLHGTEGYIEIL